METINNMKQITIEELKFIQLDILKTVHDFCNENQIRYSLAYGTLLGAIRHNGYIPWDDDIDIIMPRPDYNRFIKEFNCFSKIYKVTSPEINFYFYAPYANVFDNRTLLKETHLDNGDSLGIKIDVFPIDGVSPNTIMYSIQRRCISILNSLRSIKVEHRYSNHSYKYYLKRKVVSIIPMRLIQKLIVYISQLQHFENANYARNIVFESKNVPCIQKEIYEKMILHKFEEYHFYILEEFDTVLRGSYGDYMKLPPKELRIPHHNFEAYWK